MKSGAKILVKITEVTSDKIVFKNCDTQSSFSSIINEQDVSHIHYANGIRASFGFQKISYANKKGIKRLLMASLVTFILAVICVVIVFAGRMNASLGRQLYLLFGAIALLIISVILLLIAFAFWIAGLSKSRE
jgi:hypothetical protein